MLWRAPGLNIDLEATCRVIGRRAAQGLGPAARGTPIGLRRPEAAGRAPDKDIAGTGKQAAVEPEVYRLAVVLEGWEPGKRAWLELGCLQATVVEPEP